MKKALLSAALVPALVACGPALTQISEPGLPSFYTPGRGTPSAAQESGAQGDAEAAPAAASAQKEPARTWKEDAEPVAGPAPRNADSGGQLDLGVVPPAPQGTPRVGAPTHGIAPTDSGRLYILELYQEVLDQRDALAQEVAMLTRKLESAQVEQARLRGDAAREKERVAALDQENAALRAELQDLAARLATAQLRRLESEKVLLENRIDAARRALAAEEPRTAAAAGTER